MQHNLGLIQSSVKLMERLIMSPGFCSGGIVTVLHRESRTHLPQLHSVPLSSRQAEPNHAGLFVIFIVICIVTVVIERNIFTAVKVRYE